MNRGRTTIWLWRLGIILFLLVLLPAVRSQDAPEPDRLALLGSEDPAVRRAAALSFRGAGDEEVKALVTILRAGSPYQKAGAARALAIIDRDAHRWVPEVVDCLDDEHPLVRREAAIALGITGREHQASVKAIFV